MIWEIPHLFWSQIFAVNADLFHFHLLYHYIQCKSIIIELANISIFFHLKRLFSFIICVIHGQIFLLFPSDGMVMISPSFHFPCLSTPICKWKYFAVRGWIVGCGSVLWAPNWYFWYKIPLNSKQVPLATQNNWINAEVPDSCWKHYMSDYASKVYRDCLDDNIRIIISCFLKKKRKLKENQFRHANHVRYAVKCYCINNYYVRSKTQRGVLL